MFIKVKEIWFWYKGKIIKMRWKGKKRRLKGSRLEGSLK